LLSIFLTPLLSSFWALFPYDCHYPACPGNPGRYAGAVEKIYYVYLLASKRNGTLYVGMTNNLVRRVYEHKIEATDGYRWMSPQNFAD
jgi:hypothetical protein